MKDIPLKNGPVAFSGAISLEPNNEGIHPLRLRSEDRELLDDGLLSRADTASGVRLTLLTDSIAAELDLMITDSEETAYVDAVADNEIVETRGLMPTEEMQTLKFEQLPGGMKRLELWLPTFGTTTVRALRLEPDAQGEAFVDDRPKWITYGSSITMCRHAHSPARTWPATVARLRNLTLTSLGFGGQCHFDPVVARTIRDMPADFISLKLGINTYGQASYTERTWGPAVLGFILTVRDGHPEIPILVCSPIFAEGREDVPNQGGMTLQKMRTTLEELVGTLRKRGDNNIHYLDGSKMFGKEDAEAGLLPDGLHPNGDGYELMGRRFADLAFAPDGPPA